MNDSSTNRDPYPSWRTVVHLNAAQQPVEVKVKASLRWWTSFGEFHTKGTVRLERFPNTPLFRLAFTDNINESEEDVLYLPLCRMDIHRSLLESKHSCAHGIRVEFGDGATDSITKLQLIIPTNDAATNIAGVVFGEALQHAEDERCRGATAGIGSNK